MLKWSILVALIYSSSILCIFTRDDFKFQRWHLDEFAWGVPVKLTGGGVKFHISALYLFPVDKHNQFSLYRRPNAFDLNALSVEKHAKFMAFSRLKNSYPTI